jgi:hypothetical protein
MFVVVLSDLGSIPLCVVPTNSQDGLDYQDHVGMFDENNETSLRLVRPVDVSSMDQWKIWRLTEEGLKVDDDGPGPYMPTWQSSPVLRGGRQVNQNIYHDTVEAQLCFDSKSVVVGNFWMAEEEEKEKESTRERDRLRRRVLEGTRPDHRKLATNFQVLGQDNATVERVPAKNNITDSNTTENHQEDDDGDSGGGKNGDLHDLHAHEQLSELLSAAHHEKVVYGGTPISQVYFPIFDSFQDDRKPVAVMVAWLHWIDYFRDVLPASANGIQLLLKSSCADDSAAQKRIIQSFTFEINGAEVTPIGKGDQHDTYFDSMLRSASFENVQNIADGTKNGLPFHKGHCTIYLEVYPSQVFKQTYTTNTPVILTCAVGAAFFMAICMFWFYDWLIERRQRLVMDRAMKTTAIVTSLFPENIANRLMQEAHGKHHRQNSSRHSANSFLAPSRRLQGYLNSAGDGDYEDDTPMADLCKYLYLSTYCTLVMDERSPFSHQNECVILAMTVPNCTVLFADISGFTVSFTTTRGNCIESNQCPSSCS